MSTTSPKGIPIPQPGDPNNTPADITAVANWVDKRPGVEAMTTVQRDALTVAARWQGRVIYNTTTGLLEVNLYGGANWKPITRPPEIWTPPAVPAAHHWPVPAGTTRVRAILIGAGGDGQLAFGRSTAHGGGGGALVDVTLSVYAFGPTITVEIGAAGQGPDTFGGPTGLYLNTGAMIYAGGGDGGDVGGTGGRIYTTTNPPTASNNMGWLGGRGGDARPPSWSGSRHPGAGVVVARGGGAGGYWPGGMSTDLAGAGTGICVGGGDITQALAGGGGQGPRGKRGAAPGGGGAGGGMEGATEDGRGANGAACLIAYFD